MSERRDGKRYVIWAGWRDWRDPPGSRLRYLWRWVDAHGNPCDPPDGQKRPSQRSETVEAYDPCETPLEAPVPRPASQTDLFS